MGKVLKILVIVLLLLSIAAVILAHMVYGKREQVLARNQILTSGYIKLAPTIEDKLADAPEQPAPLPAKDISPASPEFIDKAPEVSDFWTKKYAPNLELGAKGMFDLNNRKGELMTLYKKNQLGDIEVDPTTGAKRTDGEGTMQAVLDELVKKSTEQLTRLNDTRQMLSIVRDELIDTINDLNKNKSELRVRTKDLDTTKAKLDTTEAELATMKPKVEAAEAAKKVAEEKASDMEKQKAEVDTKLQELEIDYKKVKKERDEFAKKSLVPQAEDTTGPKETVYNFTPGTKGKVVAVNDKWNYVLIQLDEAFIKEAMGEDLTAPTKPAPVGVVMSIKRTGAQEIFIAKVKLTQIRAKDKHAIGDVLVDWKQQPLQEGDVVFFP
ncbi:MAG: hypothetical protein A2283_21675 [Lentisphaerae bacterium RIFOXYA12_FULL_48_11]|nr:MAG: hypothetical protein A2283_21675 [Lentisphaerae bacterium RIFOXYA12_FULL_48_11]